MSVGVESVAEMWKCVSPGRTLHFLLKPVVYGVVALDPESFHRFLVDEVAQLYVESVEWVQEDGVEELGCGDDFHLRLKELIGGLHESAQTLLVLTDGLERYVADVVRGVPCNVPAVRSTIRLHVSGDELTVIDTIPRCAAQEAEVCRCSKLTHRHAKQPVHKRLLFECPLRSGKAPLRGGVCCVSVVRRGCHGVSWFCRGDFQLKKVKKNETKK